MKMSGTVTSAFGTERLPGADGLLSAGQDYSPVQHMLDWELAKLVERVWGHFEVDDETLALDLIDEVARSGSTNFLDTSHTAENFAREQYYPRWIDRTSWQNTAYETAAEHKMLCQIDRYCKDAIARYAPPELDCAKLRELERIYATAEAKLTR
jgi:trimethylamine:corrinoid methyltransferase-like protein